MRARFDDLRPGRHRSFELTGLLATGQAADLSRVRPLVEEAAGRAEAGEWVAVALTYEAAAGLQPGLSVHDPQGPVPLAWFAAFSNVNHEPRWGSAQPYEVGSWAAAVSKSDYLAMVDEIRQLIAAGDTYQVNYTIPLRTSVEGDLMSLYRGLIEAQSGGYGAFLETDEWAVLSASPELFVRWDRNGQLVTRPMKGTRRRGRTPAEDARLRDELESSDKDHAENVMIVDLLRNDLGRVCEIGTVHVEHLFDIERFDTVWQLTSEVHGMSRSDVDLIEVLAGLFPCGSVTGAPKKRTMEIIQSVEPDPRGIYCGTVGYLSPDPAEPKAHLNVAIRTVEVDRTNGQARYGAGGGITWDSDPLQEWQEVAAKAAVLDVVPEPLTLIETMRWEPDTGVIRRDRHLERLAASATHFDVPLNLAMLTDRLDAISADRALRVRVTVSRAGHHEVELGPAPALNQPIEVAIDDVPVDDQHLFLFHKTNRRTVYRDAADRHPEMEDVLLINTRGQITESTRANVAALLGDTWVTPPLSDGLLPGVLRAEMLASGQLTERSLSVADVRSADAVELISSLRGRRPAVLVDR